MEEMKAHDIKAGYEAPELLVIDLIVNNELLQGSLSNEELEDTTPLSGSWV